MKNTKYYNQLNRKQNLQTNIPRSPLTWQKTRRTKLADRKVLLLKIKFRTSGSDYNSEL